MYRAHACGCTSRNPQRPSLSWRFRVGSQVVRDPFTVRNRSSIVRMLRFARRSSRRAGGGPACYSSIRRRIDEIPPVIIRVTRGRGNCLSRVTTGDFLRVDPGGRVNVTTANDPSVICQNDGVCLRIPLSSLVSRFYVTDAGPDASACSRRRGADALSPGTVETRPLPQNDPVGGFTSH